MTSAVRWLVPLVFVFPSLTLTSTTFAQQSADYSPPKKPELSRQASPTPQPIIFSFVLRHAGNVALDPFGTSGRREVLQLRASATTTRGQFRRARLDRVGNDDWAAEGWYEIRGNTIQLYHRDASGNATGRVDVGRYLESTICLSDPENGEPLAFVYLEPVTGNGNGEAPNGAAPEPDGAAEVTPSYGNGCLTPGDPIS